MEVVVPLDAVKARRAAASRREPARLVGGVLQHQVDVAVAGGSGGHDAASSSSDVARRPVDDGVDRVEAEPVEMELLEPVEGVVDDEAADHRRPRPVEVDAGPHGVWCDSVKKAGA